MTREEEIRQAALAYSFDTDGGVTGDLNTGRDDFMKGAEWADEHPAVIWHKVADGDIPKESCTVLVCYGEDVFDVLFYDSEYKEFYVAVEHTDSSYYPIALSEVECWTELPKAPENKK